MPPPRVSPWRTPFLLAALGLLLMVGGYHLMNFPLSTPQRPQQRQMEELRRQAEKQGQTDPDKKVLADRLGSMSASSGNPRLHLLGQLSVYTGLLLFVACFLVMYRSRQHVDTTDEEDAPEEQDA